MSFLLDTNIVSELGKPQPNPNVIRWVLETEEDSLFLSVVTLAELRFGVERLQMGARRVQLESWIENEMQGRFAGRILPVDEQIARVWGEVLARSESTGRRMAAMDCFLAATALVRGFTLVTRNTMDFAGFGGEVLSPWDAG